MKRRGTGTPWPRAPLRHAALGAGAPRSPPALGPRRVPRRAIAEPRREDPRGPVTKMRSPARDPERVRASAGLSSSVPSTVMLAHGHRRARKVTTHNDCSPTPRPPPPRRRTAASRSVSGATHRLESRCVGRGTHGSEVTDEVAATARQPEVLLGGSARSACTPATASPVATTNRGSAIANDGGVVPRTTARPGGADRIAPPAKPDSLRGRRPRRHELGRCTRVLVLASALTLPSIEGAGIASALRTACVLQEEQNLNAPTTNKKLLAWVDEVAALTTPDKVV